MDTIVLLGPVVVKERVSAVERRGSLCLVNSAASEDDEAGSVFSGALDDDASKSSGPGKIYGRAFDCDAFGSDGGGHGILGFPSKLSRFRLMPVGMELACWFAIFSKRNRGFWTDPMGSNGLKE